MKHKIVQNRQLRPFNNSNYCVEAELHYINNILKLHYKIQSEQPLPTISNNPKRRWQLWENNCLEFFCAKKSSEQYFEFNFSFDSQWNAFHLDSYRKGIKEALQVENITMNYTSATNSAELIVNIPWVYNFDQIQMSAIMICGTEKQYYALAHNKDVADFHNRELFLNI